MEMTEVYICAAENSEQCFSGFVHNSTKTSSISGTDEEIFGQRDAVWVMTSSIMVFQMQTGFGLLEAGSVNVKSEINIMVKNALDVVFGGVTYWAFGFAFSFGDSSGSNPFIGFGHFFVNVPESRMGYIYALFLFQLSFATTSTTIVSGAMAERTKLISYNVFSMFMTFIYCIPAHWMWADNGFLLTMGAQDIAGCGPVHLVGGVTGLVATLMIGPRKGVFDSDERQPMPSPLKTILGMFMLWWGWLRFNSGSVFVVSSSEQWKYAVRAAVNTIIASIGGGITSVVISQLMSRFVKREKRFPYEISTIVNGVLGSLVSITAICTLCDPWEAFAIGCIGVLLTVPTEMVVTRLKIDDPVGVIPVHAVCSIWGLLAVGLFIPEKESSIEGQGGVFKTGQFYLLGVQTLSIVLIIIWTLIFATLSLKVIDLTIGLRLLEEHEIIGADVIEHGIGGPASGTDVAAESVMSLTNLAENAMSEEFKHKVNHLLKDFFRSICRNELYLTVKQADPGCLGLEIRSLAAPVEPTSNGTVRESEKSGDDNDEDGSKNGKETFRRRQVMPMEQLQVQLSAATQTSAATHLDAHAGRSHPASSRLATPHSSGLHVSMLRMGPKGTAMQLMDDQGRSTTRIISTDENRPSSSGFEAVASPY